MSVKSHNTRLHRALQMGAKGAVASNHPAATQAGLDVLRQGGNAADAGVAIALALGVSEPFMSGLGGDGFYHYFRALDGRGFVFNGSGAAPLAADPESFRSSGIPARGPRSVSVPGVLAALGLMNDRLGTLDWSRLCSGAISLARDGFAVSHTYRRYTAPLVETLRQNPTACRTFLHEGELPSVGSIVRQPELAGTLAEIASQGWEALYRGTLARRLVEDFASAEIMIGAADLEAIEALEQEPILVSYRGFEVRQTPPNSVGFALLQQLKILEQFDLASLPPLSADLIHIMVEAKKRAFIDRETFARDPLGSDFDETILSDEYCARAARLISMDRAADVPVGPRHAGGDTTYFCVVDKEGNALSGIQSLNTAFGSCIVADSTGVVLNNRMQCWHLDPDHPNMLAPGKRVRHTMNAPMLLSDGAVWGVLGTPGADDQVQINAQIIVSLVDHGFDPQQAVELPRWSNVQPGQDSKWPHLGDDKLLLENPIDAQVMDALRQRGHRVADTPWLHGPGAVSCIRVLHNGIRVAGADPRRDGWAGAY